MRTWYRERGRGRVGRVCKGRERERERKREKKDEKKKGGDQVCDGQVRVRKGRKVALLSQNSPTVPLMTAMLGINEF
jgi:hypothetical protein